jgi:hypothetical protein
MQPWYKECNPYVGTQNTILSKKSLSLVLGPNWGWMTMETFGYDILKKDSVGAPIWLEAVRDLDTAKKRVAELAENSPGEYVVFCEQTSRIVASFLLA